jgi:hypothetical protein
VQAGLTGQVSADEHVLETLPAGNVKGERHGALTAVCYMQKGQGTTTRQPDGEFEVWVVAAVEGLADGGVAKTKNWKVLHGERFGLSRCATLSYLGR